MILSDDGKVVKVSLSELKSLDINRLRLQGIKCVIVRNYFISLKYNQVTKRNDLRPICIFELPYFIQDFTNCLYGWK